MEEKEEMEYMSPSSRKKLSKDAQIERLEKELNSLMRDLYGIYTIYYAMGLETVANDEMDLDIFKVGLRKINKVFQKLIYEEH